MSDEPSPEEFAQQQKDNCIFCKMVAGEVPARKVYEDEHIMAILDINPAAKGHVLVMPKEHYPILPVIPFQTTQHLFKESHKIMNAIKASMMVPGVTLFIANGAIAGQQSPHFLFHLIPREHSDMLPLVPPTNGNPAENAKVNAPISGKITQFMNAYLQEIGRGTYGAQAKPIPPKEEEAPAPAEVHVNPDEHLDKLIAAIDANEDLKHAIVDRPDEVKEMVATKPKWKELFGDVDIDQLSTNLKVMIAKNQKEQSEEENDLDKISKVL